VGERWVRFFDAAGAEPRETLLLALERYTAEANGESEPLAVDLGCGTGRDSLELLRRGWRVLAVDVHPEALKRLRSKAATLQLAARLETLQSSFETASWPTARLLNSSFALPFCTPDRFDDLWRRIVSSLEGGGRFSGQLFGDRDEWADNRELTFHTRTEVEALLDGFDLERFDEVENDGQTALGEAKHWHLFHIVARRRG
jgi:SAM-dependent methyltransferase